jgi:hypothetical protein
MAKSADVITEVQLETVHESCYSLKYANKNSCVSSYLLAMFDQSTIGCDEPEMDLAELAPDMVLNSDIVHQFCYPAACSVTSLLIRTDRRSESTPR